MTIIGYPELCGCRKSNSLSKYSENARFATGMIEYHLVTHLLYPTIHTHNSPGIIIPVFHQQYDLESVFKVPLVFLSMWLCDQLDTHLGSSVSF